MIWQWYNYIIDDGENPSMNSQCSHESGSGHAQGSNRAELTMWNYFQSWPNLYELHTSFHQLLRTFELQLRIQPLVQGEKKSQKDSQRRIYLISPPPYTWKISILPRRWRIKVSHLIILFRTFRYYYYFSFSYLITYCLYLVTFLIPLIESLPYR